MRDLFRVPTALFAAAAVLAPLPAAAKVTDEVAYKEAIGCAAVITVASVVMGGSKEAPATPEMAKASEETKVLAAKWLERADGLNPGEMDATVKLYNDESMGFTQRLINAKSKEEIETNFGADFRRCLNRSMELGLR